MKKVSGNRVLVLMLMVTLISLKQFNEVYAQSRMTINCDIETGLIPTSPFDTIFFEIEGIDSTINHGTLIAGNGSIDASYILSFDSTEYDLLSYTGAIDFSYHSVWGSCMSHNIEYEIDSLLTYDAEIVVNKFKLIPHYFNYGGNTFCENRGIIEPVTDIPVSEIEIVDSFQVSITEQKQILTASSQLGTHYPVIETNHCLSDGGSMDTLIINIVQETDYLPDTIHHCYGHYFEYYNDYNVWGVEAWATDPATQSGPYEFVPKDPMAYCDSIYLTYVEVENVTGVADSVTIEEGSGFVGYTDYNVYSITDVNHETPLVTGSFSDGTYSFIPKDTTSCLISKDVLVNFILVIDTTSLDTLKHCYGASFVGYTDHFDIYRIYNGARLEIVGDEGPDRSSVCEFVTIDSSFSGLQEGFYYVEVIERQPSLLPDTINHCIGNSFDYYYFNYYVYHTASDPNWSNPKAEIEVSDYYYFNPKVLDENCYNYKYSYVDVQGHISLDLEDTVNICGDDFSVLPIDEFNVYTSGSESWNPTSSENRSGYYYFYPKISTTCYISDSVYLNFHEIPDFDIVQEEYCDYTLVRAETDGGSSYSINWSSGEREQDIKVYSSEQLEVEVVGENQCKNTKQVDVVYEPFIVEVVAYDYEDSDCWETGRIAINGIQTKYNREVSDYSFINTLNGDIVENNDGKLKEGIYEMHFTDGRDCNSVYPEHITIKQRCLENYPVFSPGVDEDYFIPYEGIVKIYDRTGHLIKELETPAYWDGSDSKGNVMPMGNYIILTDQNDVVNITIVR